MIYPKISIITCVYNGEKYISKLLDSVLKMGYPNIEHIIVNDGSTDSTEEIILYYSLLYINEGKNLYIKYIKQNNTGLGGATNTGLKAVTGEYWTWINCDDWYEPRAFNKAMDFFNKKREVLILNNFSIWQGEESHKIPCIKRNEKFSYGNQHILKKKLYSRRLKYTHFIVKTSAFDYINKERTIDPFRYTNDVQYVSTIYGNLKTHFLFKPISDVVIRDDSFYNVSKNVDRNGFFNAAINSVRMLNIGENDKKSQINLFLFNKDFYKLSDYYLNNDKNGFYSYLKNYLLPLKHSILKKYQKYISNRYYLFLFYYYFPFFWFSMHLCIRVKRYFKSIIRRNNQL